MDADDPERGGLGRVVGIGAAAGGVDALTRLFGTIEVGRRAAILVVLHVPATGRSLLAPILDRHPAHDVTVAEHGEALLRAVGTADAVLDAEAIGRELGRLADGRRSMREHTAVASATDPSGDGPRRPSGPPTSLTCPECQGPLWHVEEAELVRALETGGEPPRSLDLQAAE